MPSDTGMGMGGMESEPSGDDNTFYLPPDYPNAQSLKPGDTITLRVVNTDDAGEVEVEPVGEEQNWKTDLKESLSTEPEE